MVPQWLDGFMGMWYDAMGIPTSDVMGHAKSLDVPSVIRLMTIQKDWRVAQALTDIHIIILINMIIN